MLLAASCLFYMAFVPKYLFILIIIIGIDFWAGLAMDKVRNESRKFILAASLLANIGILFIFKYYNFFSMNISAMGQLILPGWSLPVLSWALPLGLSFHTFQAMAYTIEVYLRRYPAERKLHIYALYVLYYPQLVAGPIERPQYLLPQLHSSKDFSVSNFVDGLKLMLWGFFKKVVIADRLTVLVDLVYQDPASFSGPMLLLAMIFFSFQIYCDFSGYTDIARGASQVMGIRLMLNFKRPYLASSLTDFWRRWHISLSSWFRDYVYIPLGGNRVSLPRSYVNLFTVFILSGFWHGAAWTYIIWGLLHGIGVSVEKWVGKTHKTDPGILRRAATFLLVSIAWVYFRATSLTSANQFLKGLTRGWSLNQFRFDIQGVGDHGFYPMEFLISVFLCLILLVIEALEEERSFNLRLGKVSPALRIALYYLGIVFVLIFGKFSQEKFIYFQF